MVEMLRPPEQPQRRQMNLHRVGPPAMTRLQSIDQFTETERGLAELAQAKHACEAVDLVGEAVDLVLQLRRRGRAGLHVQPLDLAEMTINGFEAVLADLLEVLRRLGH